MNDYFGRKYVLDVGKGGDVMVREKSTRRKLDDGLPVYSTDTREQAMALVLRHCRLARDGSGTYTLNEFDGRVESLPDVSALFHATAMELAAAAAKPSEVGPRKATVTLEVEPLFALGQLVHTPGASALYTDQELTSCLQRHAAGDWGTVAASSRRMNDRAAKNGDRILSVYKFAGKEDLSTTHP